VLKTYSFPPFRRIRERHDFQKTFRHGSRLYSSLYILYYRQNDLSHARLGVVVSKRNVPKAVKRNQVKRLAREVFRLKQIDLNDLDIVLVARKKANIATKEELERCLEKLFVLLIS